MHSQAPMRRQGSAIDTPVSQGSVAGYSEATTIPATGKADGRRMPAASVVGALGAMASQAKDAMAGTDLNP